MLDEARELNGDRWHVFLSRRRPHRHIGVCGRAFPRWREAAAVRDFKGTGIRSAVVDGLARGRVRLEVIQAAMHHGPSDITRRCYMSRDSLLPDVARALSAWGAHVERVVSGEAADLSLDFPPEWHSLADSFERDDDPDLLGGLHLPTLYQVIYEAGAWSLEDPEVKRVPVSPSPRGR